MLTACSSDGENEPGGNHPVAPGDGLQTKTYTDADALSLSVDDEQVIGQTVTFTPAAGGTGTVTIAGAPFDFDGMMMDAGDNNGPAFVARTVIRLTVRHLPITVRSLMPEVWLRIRWFSISAILR